MTELDTSTKFCNYVVFRSAVQRQPDWNTGILPAHCVLCTTNGEKTENPTRAGRPRSNCWNHLEKIGMINF
jgi:hypothetical protein